MQLVSTRDEFPGPIYCQLRCHEMGRKLPRGSFWEELVSRRDEFRVELVSLRDEAFFLNTSPTVFFREYLVQNGLSCVFPHASQLKYQKYTSFAHRAEELSNQTLIFHSEATLLKSSSLFPYFMLVAIEAGGLLRALIFLLLYPFVCLFGEELGLKIQIFLCFFGLKKESFRIGASVLPKLFLQDVGVEGFDGVMICGRKVAVSDLPRIMVEGFLKDYLGVDIVVGRELKVVCGYYVGLVEEKKSHGIVLDEILGEDMKTSSAAIGICSYKKFLDQHLLAHCKVGSLSYFSLIGCMSKVL
jgi:hypothetical protein